MERLGADQADAVSRFGALCGEGVGLEKNGWRFGNSVLFRGTGAGGAVTKSHCDRDPADEGAGHWTWSAQSNPIQSRRSACNRGGVPLGSLDAKSAAGEERGGPCRGVGNPARRGERGSG